MGTRGYFVYRFRGRYYALYLPYDTYPRGLGKQIIETIPEDPKGYRCWLEDKISFLAKWDQVLEEQILCISSSRLVKDGPDFDAGKPSWSLPEPPLSKLLDERMEGDLPTPCYLMPQLDLYIEYTYIMDLDREVLTINNGAHFVLSRIPRDSWMKSLAFDHGSVALINPDLVPDGVIAHLPSLRFKDSKPEETKMTIQHDKVIHVVPKAFLNFPMVLRHGPLLLAHLWMNTKASLQKSMSWVLRGLTPDDFAFRELAFSIVSLSAGLVGGLMLANGQRRVKATTSNDWSGFITGNDPHCHPTVLSDVGIGYHAEGTEPGSSPQASSYWFHGALIKLVADLTDPDRVQEAIVQAIGFGRSAHTAAEVFDVVLLSIEHVVLLHVAGNHIQRTETLPLLEIPIHYTDSLQRYAEDYHDPAWEWRDCTYKKLFENEVRGENDADNGGVDVSVEPAAEDNDLDASGERKEEWPQTYRGFFAMVHLFEAGTKRAMPLDRPKEGVFPTEIYDMILSYVDDATYRACSTVSPKFRHYCQRNLRLVEGTRICGLAPPVVNTAQTASNQDRADETGNFEQYIVDSKETLSGDWSMVRFILEDESGEWYGAYNAKALYKWQKAPPQTTEWLTICGESDRLSFINSFAFIDYWPADLWEEEEDAKANRVEQDRPGPFALLLQAGDHSRFWSSAYVVSELSQMEEITMRSLPELWVKILAVYIRNAPHWQGYNKFEYPPHTQVTIVDTGYMCGSMCVGYIRYKRPDAIAGPSQVWELARREAEEDISKILTEQDHQQIFAIIAVDLSAELFHWDIEGQKLLPAAEKRLEIFAEGDREKLEAFLQDMGKVFAEVTEDGLRRRKEEYQKERELEQAAGDKEPISQGAV